MPDLSANISNTIALDYTVAQGVGLVVTDNGTYPGGVEAGLTGIITVTQPDGATRTGNFASPDLVYSGGNLQPGAIELRRNSDSKPQEGTYIVAYTIHHADYTNTTLTRTFELSFNPITTEITITFDVFTPSLVLSDDNDYAKAGFTTSGVRAWDITVGTVTVKTGTASSLDLIHNGNYYDAVYTGTLITTIVYTHTTYTYLTVKWAYPATLDTTADTPYSIPEIVEFIDVLKNRLENAANNDTQTVNYKRDYEYANSLYNHFLNKLIVEDYSSIATVYRDLIQACHNNITPAYNNTNQVIPPYDISFIIGGGGGGISSINTLGGSSQTFAVGESGTDFEINSAGSTHTFNMPTASAVNRGLLSAEDWATFSAGGGGGGANLYTGTIF